MPRTDEIVCQDYCPFCARLAAGNVILLGTHSAAVPDERPRSKGHCLIIPKDHVSDYFALQYEVVAEMSDLLFKVKALLEKELKPDGWNVRINVNHAGGQTVEHAHIHLVPRYNAIRINVESL